MQDKETKEWEKKLRKLELLETNYGFQGRDDSYQIDYEILIDFIESIEQEAERRGYQRHREEVVDRIKCLPSKKKCRPTVKNGRRNWLPVRYSPREILLKLLEEENGKQNAR